jgi:hypothetical protein
MFIQNFQHTLMQLLALHPAISKLYLPCSEKLIWTKCLNMNALWGSQRSCKYKNRTHLTPLYIEYQGSCDCYLYACDGFLFRCLVFSDMYEYNLRAERQCSFFSWCCVLEHRIPTNSSLHFIRCFKKSFKTLKAAYINLIRGRVQCFELS